MSASEALSMARAAGVKIGLDGGDLVLEASAPPPGAVIEALSRHKPGIVAILQSDTSGWSVTEWQDFYQERAAIMEYDGKCSRQEAERQALEWCITNWLAANPPDGLCDELCAACGDPVGRIGEDAIPLLAGKESHAWVHHACVDRWRMKWRGLAVAALAKMGVYKGSEISESISPTSESPQGGLYNDRSKNDGLGVPPSLRR